MIQIPEYESVRFPTDWFFERTERLRGKIEECTREELIDLTSHLMNEFSKFQGRVEKLDDDMQTILGWNDPLK